MNKRQLGTTYEQHAKHYLEAHGYEILQMNYRCNQGEIDVIGMQGEYLCFIEVKYRRNGRLGNPLEAVTPAKQRKILQVARYYLYTHPERNGGKYRFDVIGIMPPEICLIQNAFGC